MPEKQQKGRFVGHSKQFSLSGALEDAVQQAASAQGGIADGMVEFEVVGVRGRSGGIAGFRDVWVEISVGHGGGEAHQGEDEGPTMTTLAVGEEGGDAAVEAAAGESEEAGSYTTMAIGEEGGDAAIGDPPAGDALGLDPEGVKLEAAAVSRGGTDKYTTLAVGEEGG